ncbi:FliM/FliN family flagellar motor switch protein [Nioella sp.]|uniref:FliM/FliN family flagellar motor switch protein n=1 Tax=Nioella sp. TaxID=1912091 RepID=UPI003B52A17C
MRAVLPAKGNVMPSDGFNPGLRLKIRSPKGEDPDQRARAEGVDPALTRALGKAGAPYEGLSLAATPDAPKWDLPLADVIAALPEGGLVCLLEAGQDRRAICALDHGAVDALIEVQTTGRVDKGPGLPRAPTMIDAALTRDFIGLFLSAFAGEMTGAAGVDWPLGLTYGTHLPDPRGLELLLPDHPCHLFSATLDLGEGAKKGRILLAVPVTGTDSPAPKGTSPAPGWGQPWHEIVMAAPAMLEAVLLRQTLPLSKVERLQAGDVLPFDRSDLASVAICDVAGRRLFSARLGKAGSRRAINLTAGDGLRPAPAPPPPPQTAPAPPQPPQAAPPVPEEAPPAT